jgi:crotonobetainyl-CoA:carnitine CoA-transferase CaiB-like acyl-CoA transferase
MSAGVLAGLRVLDFGRYVAGPYCATLLGYLGAEVIRIEKLEGSEDRFIAPVAAGGEGGVFFQTACNKKSLTLDPATPAGREVVRRLVHTADIVVANLPPASLPAWARRCRAPCTCPGSRARRSRQPPRMWISRLPRCLPSARWQR